MKFAPLGSRGRYPKDDWISWERWSQLNGFEKPKRLATESNVTFQSRSENDTFTLTVGTRVASWNGLSVCLGFGPQLTNGSPFIHVLDAVKNLDPLLLSLPAVPKTNRMVVIDPGHGGENTGTKCVLNTGYEKDYTLDWAIRLRPLLRAKGWNVSLTRTNDKDLSLLERVEFAEKLKADLFLSLHFNSVDPAAARPDHGGVETYCLTPAGMPSNLTRGFPDNLKQVYPNNAFDAQNLQYAVRLHRAMLEGSERKDRGVRRARFLTVLRGQNRPAVLLEGGYMSDPQEARLIATGAYRQKLAQAVAKALE